MPDRGRGKRRNLRSRPGAMAQEGTGQAEANQGPRKRPRAEMAEPSSSGAGREKRRRPAMDDGTEPDSDIWVIGDSIPYWAGCTAFDIGMENFKLQNITAAWWCKRGMSFESFTHALQLPSIFRHPPKVIIIHLGEMTSRNIL
ncbi:uncharacterized protein LOC128555125 [Mercenaria mercenaria]|uniref:uncharacterized protein LOC128555125 n=1 Tax=Mercenaria mercenaria TaxID=6596 RepID=UPI00234E4A8F|nr:uncharacterized protein LOC128555125 [Mercenaria mercenaria]